MVILGPTASGKTRLAVEVARVMSGEIISADSRQVYRGMDIGTGKDLHEYKGQGFDVPYHLIDILPAGEKYNLNEFLRDTEKACNDIISREKLPIVCGGTGLYIHALLMGYGSTSIPVNDELRSRLNELEKEDLMIWFNDINHFIDIPFDTSTRKRLIRSIEICEYLALFPDQVESVKHRRKFDAVVFGLNPSVELRRDRISKRLEQRLNEGLIEEVRGLLDSGLNSEQLIYYGLEYKYVTNYLTGILTFDEMKVKLETEIHRFAKRQMTFFRKMERDGIDIHWLDDSLSLSEKINNIKDTYNCR